jgi:hypothetical protein
MFEKAINCQKLLKEVSAVSFFLLIFSLTNAQNVIVTENAQPGNSSSEWDIDGAGDLSIQGFATDISVNKGETVRFKIKTDASTYTIKIYRLGYYQGNGARFMGNGVITATLPQIQPADLYEVSTGRTDCSNWAESAHWDVPGNAVSGIYIAKLTRTNNGGASHIVFIVRDDAGSSALLFQTSDATWQAYNNYGGNSLYVNGSGTAVPGFNHATKVSYNRPFLTRNGGGGGGAAEDWLFNAEYPMIRWLERNGYDVSYTTEVDMNRNTASITPANHKVVMSIGHDEYWSAAARIKFENARNAGVHLAFFSGNEVYWKTRWEDNYRTMVCYKEGSEGENVCNGECDPSNEWTGLWRTGCGAVGADDGCRPENGLSGQISWDGTTTAIQVPDTYKNLRFWRNTSIATLSAGQTRTFPNGTLGYEWDWEQPEYSSSYPPGRVTMSSTTSNGHTHKLSLYKHSSGALVFGAGTVQWSWGLDAEHDRGGTPIDKDMQQATVNLFADMGVQPASLQAGLIAATASTDQQAPVTTISSPAQGATLNSGSPVTITGTASDGGGIVAGVEVSVDGGTTWNVANGTTNWNFTWTPASGGSATIKSRAFDDIGNIETAGTVPASNAIAVTVGGGGQAVCPCTIFQPASIPSSLNGNDNQSIELGVKFRTTTNGFITGIRFYKASGDNGTHIGHLWTSTGTSLGQVTFSGESASGWQQVNFGAPIAVTANTTYIASYHSSANVYAYSDNFFTTAVQNGPLKALANGEDGPNGVYIYSVTPAFPTQTFQSSNYWVDVVYDINVGPDVTSPVVASTLPAGNAAGVNVNNNINVTFNEPIDASTVNSTNFELRNGSALVPASITYNAGSQTAVLDPASSLSYLTTYTATIKGGASGIKDVAGNSLANDFTWSFTTQSQPVLPPPLVDPATGPGGPILVISSTSNPFSRYSVEILRAEGLNEFAAMDISAVTATTLNSYDVVVLGEISVTAAQVTLLTDWVNAGGTLIAFKPSSLLYPLLGITSAGGTLSDKYLLVNTSGGAGAGIVAQTIQFHGTANLYALNGATSVATLYSDAATATTNPAVSTRSVGENGGKAVAFAYDLARSIVYTRQGNPAWAGQERDGETQAIRSDDMFYPNWIDFNKVAIPQADEQQHLLANLILQSNLHRKPLPRFWFLPRKLKAVVVMTGDDHGNGGTVGRFNQYLGFGNNTAADVVDWKAIRGTSYIYPNTPITNEQAVEFENQGFEIALHLNTGCTDYTPASLENDLASQLADFAAEFPGVSPPGTNRTHCIVWSDWASKPKVELAHGIRLNTDYYYWPAAWIQNRPGMFTGSGMPMRFADLDGTIIDNYQVTTQLTDESGITYSTHINQLLDKAIGAEGYYGVFCANMHTDVNGGNSTDGSNTIIASAQGRQIPVISAKQMLTWLDSRNTSSFGALTWNNNTLNFSISAAAAANKLQAMVPVKGNSGQLSVITRNGTAVSYTTEVIKGINYAFFDATSGNYTASYSAASVLPAITAVAVTTTANGTANINWTTDIPSDSRVDYGTSADNLNLNQSAGTMVNNHSVSLSGLTPGTTYYYRVTSSDGSTSTITEPNPPAAPFSFRMSNVCASDQTLADFNLGTTGANTSLALEADGEVILKPVLNEEFSGSTVPAAWGQGTFNAGGGTTISNGSATVSGTHLFSNSSFGTGSSIEFVATYNSGSFQNVGVSADQSFNSAPWVTIGQGGSPDGNLYARSSVDPAGGVNLGPLLGAPHHFLIKWNAGNFEFYVDGSTTPTATIPITVSEPMFVQISDVNTSDGSLSVDWLRVTPYATSGSFTSRIFDAASTTNWGAVTWIATVPSGTGLQLFVRTGNTASPDNTWSNFTAVTNGGNVGVTSRYLQYRVDLSTTDTKLTPVLKEIGIECSQGSDNTPPVITTIVATSAIDGTTATVTWTTNEPANSRVDFGTSASTLTQNSADAALTSSHSLQLTGLVPGTTYYYRVSSTDGFTNSSTEPTLAAAPLSFITSIPACFEDITYADFISGATGSETYVSALQDGEIILRPAAASEFNSLPPATEWQGFSWTSGGTFTAANGILTVDGARYNSEPATATFGPGSNLEFVATFGASSFQHIGFGGGSDVIGSGGIYNGENPWAMFSTNSSSNTLQARTSVPGGSSSNFLIPNSEALIGTPHKYRISWKTDGTFDYYVDDVLVRSEPIIITTTMRPAVSDFNTGAPGIAVDWIHASPYQNTGSFLSRIFDAGGPRSWGAVNWTADVPVGTTLQLSQRQGNTPLPDGTWTSFSPITANGAIVGGASQYIQYRTDFTTTSSSQTPLLKDVHFNCSATGTLIGTIGLRGRPAAPNAQWQIPVVVSLYNGTTLVNTYNVTTNENGQFTIAGVTPGIYTITVKGTNTLRRVLRNQTVSGGTNNVSFGVLISGDANGDNFIGGADFSLMVNTYNKGVGMAGYDARADFNGDGFVTGADFSLLVSAYNQLGETP